MRESGLELLRIICMLQIIFLHFGEHTGYRELASKMGGINSYISSFTYYLCRAPIYIFLMLTGYFLVKKVMTFQDVKRRILKVYAPMLFFSILIPIIFLGLNIVNLTDVNVPKMFFPFLSRTWYFLSGYILIIIFSPFLNKLIHAMDKKEFKTLLIIIALMLCGWRILANLEPFNKFISTELIIINQGGKSLYDYIFMYLLGGYLSLYWKNSNKLEFKYLFIFIYCAIMQCILIKLHHPYSRVATYNDNIFAVIQAVCLILFFRNLKFKSKVINYISSYTLAIYIIHEHYLVRNFIWSKVFAIHSLAFFNYIYPLKIIGVCVIIFLGCMLIDFLRRILFAGVGKIKNKVFSQ